MKLFKKIVKRFLDVCSLFLIKRLGILRIPEACFVIPSSPNYLNETPYNWLKSVLNISSNKVWLESKSLNLSVMNGEPVPWITYPAIHFIKQIDLSNSIVVEFGSGASTLFFAKRCKKIISYEFDEKYLNALKSNIRDTNIEFVDGSFIWSLGSKNGLDPEQEISLKNDIDFNKSQIKRDEYNSVATSLRNLSDNIAQANFVIVDGGPRNFLTVFISKHLNKDASLLIDNSDLEYVRYSFASLKRAGYCEIPFFGFGPLNPYEFKTSIFIKDLNALKTTTLL